MNATVFSLHTFLLPAAPAVRARAIDDCRFCAASISPLTIAI